MPTLIFSFDKSGGSEQPGLDWRSLNRIGRRAGKGELAAPFVIALPCHLGPNLPCAKWVSTDVDTNKESITCHIKR